MNIRRSPNLGGISLLVGLLLVLTLTPIAQAFNWAVLPAGGSSQPYGLLQDVSSLPVTTQNGTILTTGLTSDAKHINPDAYVTSSDLNVLLLIYNTLVQGNSSGLPTPGIATSWTVSPDGLRYSFTIVSGAEWQDGRPLTASDVAFSFNYWKQYGLPYATFPQDVNSAVALDAQHAVVTLNSPFPALLLDLAEIGLILPQHIWQNVTTPHTFTNLVGSGPFSFVSRTPGVDIVLRANHDYFGGAPKYEYVVMRIYSSVDSAVADIQVGNLNLFQLPAGQNLAAFESNSAIHIVTTKSALIYFIGMNTQTFPFNDTLVRRAMAYAVDSKQILSLAFQGQGEVANSTLAPSLAYYYNPNVTVYSHNPGKAVTLLKQDGYSNSSGKWLKGRQELTFALEITNTAPWIQISTLIQQQLQAIGISVNVKAVDSNTKSADVGGSHNYQMEVGTWRLDYDPMLFLQPCFYSGNAVPNGNDFTLFKNSTVDALLNQAGNATTISQQRNLIYQIQIALASQVPVIMLAYGQDNWVIQGFTGWKPVARYGLWYYDTFDNLSPITIGGSGPSTIPVAAFIAVVLVAALIVGAMASSRARRKSDDHKKVSRQ